MPIKFRCPNCRQFLGISREKAGALTDCPTCGRTIRIPDLDGQVKPLPKPKLNLGDSELAGALDALARLDTPGASGEADESKPVAVALEPDDVQELEPVPPAEPVAVQPALPAVEMDPKKTGGAASSPTANAAALNDIIRLSPDVARAEATSLTQRGPGTVLTVGAVVGGILVFGLGILVGRFTAPAGRRVPVEASSIPADPAEAEPDEPIPAESAAHLIPALSGRLTYVTDGGDVEPDAGARIIALPIERIGTAKLAVVGFRAGAADADRTLAKTSLRALGGDYVIADEQGEYTVQLGAAGDYQVLFLSRFQPRDETSFLAPPLQEALSTYFDRPTALVGPVAYEFAEFTFRGDAAVPRDHVFQRE